MDSRQRVLTALRHEEPDRVPYNLRPAPTHRETLRAETDVGFEEHFGHDVRYVSIPLPPKPDDVPADQWTPTPPDEAVAACAEQVRQLHEQGVASCGAYACGVFEQAKGWLGDVTVLTMPNDDPAGLEALLDRITQWKKAVYGGTVRAGVDIVWIGDDLGIQRSLVMSPEDYRRWYRPRHIEIVEHLRALRPDVRIAFHCCGHVTPLIGDLIEVGIDILEAVQPEAMDIGELKREFGRDISFWGGIGMQSLLAYATPDEVAVGVRETIRVLAPGGGWIAAPCHTLTDELPWPNVVAYHEAIRRDGH